MKRFARWLPLIAIILAVPFFVHGQGVRGGASGAVSQGSPAAGVNAWPMAVTDTANTVVKPGDAVNSAVKVNVVAGAAAGVASYEQTSGTDQSAVVFDADTGVGTQYVAGVNLREAGSGGSVELGVPANPLSCSVTDTANVKVKPGDTTNNAVRVNVVAGSAAGVAAYEQSSGTDQSAIVYDTDSGAGTQYTAGVNLRKSASGGSVEFGTSTDPIRIDPTGATAQPVSGSVTANAGNPPATVNAWPIKVTDGVDTASVSGSGFLQVDGSGVTQPVSGTVSVTQGTAAAGSGAWPVSVTDSSNTIVKPGDSTNNAMRVNVVAGSIAGVASFEQAGGADASARLYDSDSGAGTELTAGMMLRKSASGGSQEIGIPSMPLSMSVTDTANTEVKAGDATNNALRVNVVAGSAAGVASYEQSNGTDTSALVYDTDSGAGAQFTAGVSLRKSMSGGSVEFGTSTDPIRIDPTGSTAQPVSGTVTSNQGTAAAGSSAWPIAITDTSNTIVKPGDASNNAIRVSLAAGAVPIWDGVETAGVSVDSRLNTATVVDHENRWTCSADAATADVQCKATATQLYISYIMVSNGATAQNIRIVSGTGTTCGTGTTVVVPTLYLLANAGASLHLGMPYKVTAGHNVCCDTAGSTAYSCMIQGYVAP